jgi:GINS complex subunit 2
MDTSEVEFLAERSLISIIPNFDLSTLHLICGDFGPFRAGMPMQVPIWVAVNLRQRSKCRILPPDWLNVEALENLKKQELDSRYAALYSLLYIQM